MMRQVRSIGLSALAGVLVLVALIVRSSFEMSLGAGLRATVDTWWGITTMVDLYAGLLVIAGWIAYRERAFPRAAVWMVGLFLLGNLTTLVYLVFAAMNAGSLDELIRGKRSALSKSP